MRNRSLVAALVRWVEGLQAGEPVALAVLGVIILLLTFVGFMFLNDHRETQAEAKKRAARKPKMGPTPANPIDPTRPRR